VLLAPTISHVLLLADAALDPAGEQHVNKTIFSSEPQMVHVRAHADHGRPAVSTAASCHPHARQAIQPQTQACTASLDATHPQQQQRAYDLSSMLLLWLCDVQTAGSGGPVAAAAA
jgi:hypothetical protein